MSRLKGQRATDLLVANRRAAVRAILIRHLTPGQPLPSITALAKGMGISTQSAHRYVRAVLGELGVEVARTGPGNCLVVERLSSNG